MHHKKGKSDTDIYNVSDGSEGGVGQCQKNYLSFFQKRSPGG